MYWPVIIADKEHGSREALGRASISRLEGNRMCSLASVKPSSRKLSRRLQACKGHRVPIQELTQEDAIKVPGM